MDESNLAAAHAVNSLASFAAGRRGAPSMAEAVRAAADSSRFTGPVLRLRCAVHHGTPTAAHNGEMQPCSSRELAANFFEDCHFEVD